MKEFLHLVSCRKCISRNKQITTYHFTISSVYKICVSNATAVCYAEKLYNQIQEYLENHVTVISRGLGDVDASDFLKSYLEQWTIYSLGVEMSAPLFQYLVGVVLDGKMEC